MILISLNTKYLVVCNPPITALQIARRAIQTQIHWNQDSQRLRLPHLSQSTIGLMAWTPLTSAVQQCSPIFFLLRHFDCTSSTSYAFSTSIGQGSYRLNLHGTLQPVGQPTQLTRNSPNPIARVPRRNKRTLHLRRTRHSRRYLSPHHSARSDHDAH